MHVLYIHQYFSTPDGAGGTRSYEMAKALLAREHRVTMVCGTTGRSVTGLTGPFQKGRRAGVVDGIQVLELDVAYSNHDSIPTRAIKFAAFALRSIGLASRGDYDLIFATSTPLTAALPGIAGTWFGRRPFVFEVRDLWPELPRALGMRSPVALGAMHVLEWAGYKSATRLIALAPGIADGIARLGVRRERICVIPNGCDTELFDSIAPLKPHAYLPDRIAPDDFVAIFAGAHGLANGLHAVLAAAETLKQRGQASIKFLLIGDGGQKQALKRSVGERGLDNVILVDPLPKRQVVGLLKGADIGMQILADVPAFYRGTSPNKFFDYLAAGRPVLINYPGWLAEIIEREGAGFAVPARSPVAFGEALEKARRERPLLNEMALRAAALGRREFAREVLAERFCEALELAYAQSR